jgi:hypothetical protein
VIYGYILHDQALSTQNRSFNCVKECPNQFCPNQFCDHPGRYCDDLCVSHGFDPAYMGTETSEEIVYNWYRTTNFDVDRDIHLLEPLLEEHRWGLSDRPADSITKVQFTTILGTSKKELQSTFRHLKALKKLQVITKLTIWLEVKECMRYHMPGNNLRLDLGVALELMWPYISEMNYGELQFLGSARRADVIRSSEEHTVDGWLTKLMDDGV